MQITIENFPLPLNAAFVIIKFFNRSVGSILIDKHEDDPQQLTGDKFTITLVNNDSVTVGHIPKLMSKPTYVFLKHGSHIKCEITCGKRYSKDLEQDGLEIPARLTISNTDKKMTDVMIENLNPLVGEYRRINSKPK